MSWAVHESGPTVVVRITGVRALRLTPEEARELAVALLVSAEGLTPAGAKNNDGFWGTRFEVQKRSNRARRELDKTAATELDGPEPRERVD